MHGLSTLNRLLGKKNKEVSRSTSNLSKSHSNLESSSQHNKKIPILNNAPFEQTFRVTVYLPKNQLYVERIGAKTKLGKLMADVCDSKNLGVDKYELRHPADMSQVFDNDKTIGEVGLNELRLVLKTESKYKMDFHRYHSQPDHIMSKYKSSTVPESISSSEISRSNLKNFSKTSPYSSTNSLNSLDSTGMNSTNKVQPPVAPIRKKKRMAPRPPSENSIPEQEIFSSSTLNVFKEPHSILPRKNFHVSSPQLYNNSSSNYEIAQKSDSNNNHTELRSISNRLNAITRPSSVHISSSSNSSMTTEIVKMPERQRNNSESSEIQNILRDSGSKQNSLERAKKKNPAPVPPSRTKLKPTPSPRTIQEDMNSITEISEVDEQQENVNAQQKDVGDILPVDNSLNSGKIEDENGNISKVLLNNSLQTDNLSSLENEGPISIQILSSDIEEQQQQQQQKSIESVKLPVVSKTHISHEGDHEMRSASDEEEDEMTVNIYNVSKSVVTSEKPVVVKETTTVIEETHVVIENNHVVKEETIVIQEKEYRRSPSPEWTYTLPAPPVLNSIESNSINNNNNNSPTDQKSCVTDNKYYSDYMSTVNDNETILSDSNTTTVSAETHIQPIINDRRKPLDDDFIVNTKSIVVLTAADSQSDKSAEVITSDLEDGYLGNNNNNNNNSNGKIAADNDNEISMIEVSAPKVDTNAIIDKERQVFIEEFQKNRLVIARSDSFHSIGQQKTSDYEITRRNLNALPQRSTSFLSLVHSQKAEMRSSSMQDSNVPYNRQKSTSISDVPSLQSLEVIKNILNCRKASLQEINNSALSDDESTPIAEEPNNNNINSSTLAETPGKIEVKSTEKVMYNAIETRDVIKKLETQKSEPVAECNNKNNNDENKKSETQQWRYSGPPKINFSTWNERPKVEISVMSDKDYIFGGVSAAKSLPRNYSQDQPDCVDSVLRKSNYTVIITKENKEAEKHLPKVLGVEYKKDINPVMLRHNANNGDDNDDSSEINNNNSNNKTLISIKQRPASMVDYSSAISSAKPINMTNYQNQFVSYNRLTTSHNNGKKFTPIVHGFAKLDNISETQSDVKSLPITNKITADVSEKKAEAPKIPAKPSYLRSASADVNRNIPRFSPVNSNNSNNIVADSESYDEKPFSQTLRRTGLIEKMLNNDKKMESIFGKVLDKPKTNNANVDDEKVEKVVYRQHSQPIKSSIITPPPPPPPMTFRKSAPAGESNDIETRSQLLDAIKHFNMDSLRRK